MLSLRKWIRSWRARGAPIDLSLGAHLVCRGMTTEAGALTLHYDGWSVTVRAEHASPRIRAGLAAFEIAPAVQPTGPSDRRGDVTPADIARVQKQIDANGEALRAMDSRPTIASDALGAYVNGLIENIRRKRYES